MTTGKDTRESIARDQEKVEKKVVPVKWSSKKFNDNKTYSYIIFYFINLYIQNLIIFKIPSFILKILTGYCFLENILIFLLNGDSSFHVFNSLAFMLE